MEFPLLHPLDRRTSPSLPRKHPHPPRLSQVGEETSLHTQEKLEFSIYPLHDGVSAGELHKEATRPPVTRWYFRTVKRRNHFTQENSRPPYRVPWRS